MNLDLAMTQCKVVVAKFQADTAAIFEARKRAFCL